MFAELNASPVKSNPEYSALGLRARFALAVRAAELWCSAKHMDWPGRDSLFDLLWQLPTSEDLADWDARAQLDSSVSFGLGGDCPSDLASAIRDSGLAESDVRRLFESMLEVGYGSFYGATDDSGSMDLLLRVLELTGYAQCDVADFGCCRFEDAFGWGYTVSAQTRDHWRFHTVLRS